MSRPEDILDQVLNGELTREEAVAQQPDMEDRLLLLSELANELHSLPEVRPDADFRNRTRMRLLQHIQETEHRRRWWQKVLPEGARLPSWTNAISAAIIATGGLAFGVSYASASALPDNALYPVKRAVEQVQLRLATSDESRANTYLNLADRRAEEIAATAPELDDSRLDSLANDYGSALANVTAAVQTLPAPAPALLDKVQTHVASQATELEARALNSSSRPNVQMRLAQAEVAASDVVDHVTLIAEKTGKPGPQDVHLAADPPGAATAAAAASRSASTSIPPAPSPSVEPMPTKAPAGVLGPPAASPAASTPPAPPASSQPAAGANLDGQFDRLWNGVGAAPFMTQKVRIQLQVDVANAKQSFRAGQKADAKAEINAFMSQLQAAVASHQATQYTAARLNGEAQALLTALG
ncbi:MAG TPA: DUF5667 domain-containing protein [Chloroflexota bacterium]|nr:DUF5667 domain-containing protein [Chloroflexota bacterium]